jgi:S1-C subfamily serine protease
VVVTRVVEGTPAAAAGIALRDRVYQINGQEFADAAAFQAAILALLDGGATEFSLLIERHGQLRTVTVTLQPANASGE